MKYWGVPKLIMLAIGAMVLIGTSSTIKPFAVEPDQETQLLHDIGAEETSMINSPAWHTYRDVPYGDQALNTLDVYAPTNSTGAPIIVMVHGGGWQIGDKANKAVVNNKVNHWVSAGYVLVSINYPMLPETRPDAQADAVAASLAYIQAHAADWGGDRAKIILIGHSAGGHLAALVSAKQETYGLVPWQGTVLLDTAGYDIVANMADRPSRVFKNAFGTDPTYWRTTSPYHQLQTAHEPLFMVCSELRRPQASCEPAADFAERIAALGGNAELYSVPLNHSDINSRLGLPGEYTEAIDAFIASVL